MPHQIRIEYLQLDYGARIKLQWQSGKIPGRDPRGLDSAGRLD